MLWWPTLTFSICNDNSYNTQWHRKCWLFRANFRSKPMWGKRIIRYVLECNYNLYWSGDMLHITLSCYHIVVIYFTTEVLFNPSSLSGDHPYSPRHGSRSWHSCGSDWERLWHTGTSAGLQDICCAGQEGGCSTPHPRQTGWKSRFMSLFKSAVCDKLNLDQCYLFWSMFLLLF